MKRVRNLSDWGIAISMKNIDYSVGTHIKLHTNDAWNNMHGIVDDMLGDIIAVFCVTMPLYRYFVSASDAGRILELL